MGVLAPALENGRVDAALAGMDGRTYLFSGDTYLRYSGANYSVVDPRLPDVSTLDLDHVVDLTLIAREQTMARRVPEHLTLRCVFHPTDVEVRCRPALLSRLVRNLLDNAERHATSSITLSVTTDKDTAVLEIIDDGPGIAKPDRERVFERFTRLDHARTRDTGLGLAIARQIATAHSGTLHLTDSDRGARFTVHLPLTSPNTPRPNQ